MPANAEQASSLSPSIEARENEWRGAGFSRFPLRSEEMLKILGPRLTEPQSGLALEQKLAPADAVVRQKEKLLSAFQAALARVELSAA